jgi:hypothetical protein
VPFTKQDTRRSTLALDSTSGHQAADIRKISSSSVRPLPDFKKSSRFTASALLANDSVWTTIQGLPDFVDLECPRL